MARTGHYRRRSTVAVRTARRRAARFAIRGRAGRDDVPRICERLRAALAERDSDEVVCDLRQLLGADAGTIEVLARVALVARRLGRRVVLAGASPEVRELLALAGLTGVVGCAAEVSREGEAAARTSGRSARCRGRT